LTAAHNIGLAQAWFIKFKETLNYTGLRQAFNVACNCNAALN